MTLSRFSAVFMATLLALAVVNCKGRSARHVQVEKSKKGDGDATGKSGGKDSDKSGNKSGSKDGGKDSDKTGKDSSKANSTGDDKNTKSTDNTDTKSVNNSGDNKPSFSESVSFSFVNQNQTGYLPAVKMPSGGQLKSHSISGSEAKVPIQGNSSNSITIPADSWGLEVKVEYENNGKKCNATAKSLNPKSASTAVSATCN